jgi:predicted RNA binding protein YcfA (HicA-like mRNA interferase family)
VPERVPALQPARVIRAFEALGFERARQSGSHVILRRPGTGRNIVIAQHRRELGPKLIAKLLAQAGVTVEEFLAHV